MENESCYSCSFCSSCYSCSSCYFCSSCSSCSYCSYCYYCYYCYYSKSMRMCEKTIFSFGRTREMLLAWNKPVSEYRLDELLGEIRKILGSPGPNKTRQGFWREVTPEQWAKIAAIPEFDLEVTKKITGLDTIPVVQEKTIEIEGKKFTVEQLRALISSAK